MTEARSFDLLAATLQAETSPTVGLLLARLQDRRLIHADDTACRLLGIDVKNLAARTIDEVFASLKLPIWSGCGPSAALLQPVTGLLGAPPLWVRCQRRQGYLVALVEAIPVRGSSRSRPVSRQEPMVAYVDPLHRIQHFTRSYERWHRQLFGSTPLRGASLLDALRFGGVNAHDLKRVRSALDRGAGGAKAVELLSFVQKESDLYVELTATPWIEDGKSEGSILNLADVTVQRRMVERLSMFELAIHRTQDAVVLFRQRVGTRDKSAIFANPAFEAIVDYLLEGGRVDQTSWVMHRYDYLTSRQDIIRLLQSYLRPEQRVSIETQMFRKNGTSIWLELDIDPFRIEDAPDPHWICIIREVTEKKRYMEQRPALEKVKIRAILHSQEKERRRISQEIHDGLGQLLTGSKLSIYHAQNLLDNLTGQLEKDFADAPPDMLTRLRGVLHEVEQTLDDAINEARSISYNLMPRTLKDYGLVLALEQLATRMTKSSGVQVTFYHHQAERLKLQDNVELDLFRIAQESVNNALKYAKATAISVQLIKNEKYVTLTIEDNGQGFALKDKEQEQESSGLTNIRMRTEMLGGYATIDSNPGSGTIISVEIPVSASAY